MKKLDKKVNAWRISQNKRKRKRAIRAANQEKHRNWLRNQYKLQNPNYFRAVSARAELTTNLYRKHRYSENPLTVLINGSFGIEEFHEFDDFIAIASKIVDFRSKELELDLKNSTRIWPSAIILLASLKRWAEVTAYEKNAPLISSSTPDSDQVRSYLDHSGLYEYVLRKNDEYYTVFDRSHTVPVKREKLKDLEKKENEIFEFLRRYSKLNESELDLFNCVVLPEIFNNITEHGRVQKRWKFSKEGKPKKEEGWWVMAQLHPKHKFISVCLADNGIGIGNSLRTGGQSNHVAQELGSKMFDDGECIRLALKQNISGSIKAPPPKGFSLFKRFGVGARKGNGLKRILDRCKELRVRLSIISHNGYVVLDDAGETLKQGHSNTRLFAGTLYHMLVRAK